MLVSWLASHVQLSCNSIEVSEKGHCILHVVDHVLQCWYTVKAASEGLCSVIGITALGTAT